MTKTITELHIAPINGFTTPYFLIISELNGFVRRRIIRLADRSIPTCTMVIPQSSGWEGMTTYSIASPSKAAATARLQKNICELGMSNANLGILQISRY